VQTETFAIFLGNKTNIFSAVLIYGTRSMVALSIGLKPLLQAHWYSLVL